MMKGLKPSVMYCVAALLCLVAVSAGATVNNDTAGNTNSIDAGTVPETGAGGETDVREETWNERVTSTPTTYEANDLEPDRTLANSSARSSSEDSLTSSKQYKELVQVFEQLVFDELRHVNVPAGGTRRPEVLITVLQNINFLHVTKQLLTQQDIRLLVPKPRDVDQRCYDNVIDFLDALIGERWHASSSSEEFETPEWASRMFDAFGKPTAGILRGALQWVGNYEECLDLRAHIREGAFVGSRPTARNVSSKFKARYCRVQIYLPPLTPSQKAGQISHIWKEREEVPNLANWGVCVPEACGKRDVVDLLTQGTAASLDLTVTNAVCFERDPDMSDDAGAIVAVCILSISAGVLLVCTLLESAIHHGYLDLGAWDQLTAASTDCRPSQPEKPYVRNGISGTSSGEVANNRTPLSKDNKPRDVLKDEDQRAGDKGGRKSVGLQLLEAFSLRQNFSKLMSSSSVANPGMFMSIQGIRVISICWVVLGHMYTVSGSMDPRNYVFGDLERIPENVNRMSFVIILAANLAVDTFFAISGMLVMALTLRELRKSKGGNARFWIMFYVHRIWRLTPVYMMVLMTGTTLYDYIVEGPLKSDPYLMFEHCDKQWWTSLLYVNNLAYPNKECMFWTWYLAVDMQLYIISPIFIILVYRNRRLGILTLVVTIVLGAVCSFVVTLYNRGIIITMTATNTEYWEYVYRAPWSRIAVFAVGLLLGLIMEDVEKPTMTRAKTLLTWLLSTAVAVFIICIPHDELKEGSEFWPRGVQATYEVFSRLLWSAYIGWIIFACQKGLGGAIARFLSSQVFQPLARLTYTVYLVHPMVITFFVYSNRLPVSMNDSIIIIRFLGTAAMSYIVAAIFSLSFESPFMGVEKALLHRK